MGSHVLSERMAILAPAFVHTGDWELEKHLDLGSELLGVKINSPLLSCFYKSAERELIVRIVLIHQSWFDKSADLCGSWRREQHLFDDARSHSRVGIQSSRLSGKYSLTLTPLHISHDLETRRRTWFWLRSPQDRFRRRFVFFTLRFWLRLCFLSLKCFLLFFCQWLLRHIDLHSGHCVWRRVYLVYLRLIVDLRQGFQFSQNIFIIELFFYSERLLCSFHHLHLWVTPIAIFIISITFKFKIAVFIDIVLLFTRMVA